MGFYTYFKWVRSFSKKSNRNIDMIYWYKEYILKTTEQRWAERWDMWRRYDMFKSATKTIISTLTSSS